jgi:hypothetical protein
VEPVRRSVSEGRYLLQRTYTPETVTEDYDKKIFHKDAAGVVVLSPRQYYGYKFDQRGRDL